MTDLKEITVFTVGDANAVKTWSNVPYFFTRSLENRNILVNKVNIGENAFLNTLYKFSVYALLKIFYKNTQHSYFRSGLNYFLTNQKIKRAIKRHSSSQAYLFLTYSFGFPETGSKKIILFGDWSYLYLIDKFYKRNPYWFEKKALLRERKHINSADIVLSLFPRSKDFNLSNFANSNCHYLGNVINSFYPLNKENLAQLKPASTKLLFIGNKKYLQGALDLIETFIHLHEENKTGTELHIIGLNPSDTGLSSKNIFQHGYLDKGNETENALYYKLLSEAKFIINTTKDWGAFSAMTEAMYYHTPVITSPYPEFTATYGEQISFGVYVDNHTKEELIRSIKKLLACPHKEYLAMMSEAHEKVKDFTWEHYVEKFLKLVNS